MKKKSLKTAILLISAGFAFLFTNVSGCLPDPYEVGHPDSLYLEFVLVWLLMDTHYACFFAREDVDWDEVYNTYKNSADNLSSRDELIDLCLEMLSELEDPNVILLDPPNDPLYSWDNNFFYNWDYSVWSYYMFDSVIGCPPNVEIFDGYYLDPPLDSIAYVYISSLGFYFDWGSFFSITYDLRECKGLILDLRMCTESGIEENAYYVSGRFIDEAALSYYRSFRIGPERIDMGPLEAVHCYRNGAFQFTNPFVVLTGRGTQGAAEQLVLHLRTQAHITTIGDTTAGFANPAVRFDLDEDWFIEIPDRVTYSLDSTLILGSGIAPDIFIPVTEADFAAGVDPVLDTAIEMVTQ